MTTVTATPTLNVPNTITVQTVKPIYANQLTSLNRRTEKDPHFFGSVKMADGSWYQLATWINVKDNIQNLSTAMTLMNEEQSQKAEERQAKFDAERLANANPLTAPALAEKKEETTTRHLTIEQCEAAGIPDTDPLHPHFVAF